MPTTDLLRIADVKRRTGLSRSTIYSLMRHGRFPASIHPNGTRVAVWSSTAVDAWISSQLNNGE
jgi:prophage regulatory protein